MVFISTLFVLSRNLEISFFSSSVMCSFLFSEVQLCVHSFNLFAEILADNIALQLKRGGQQVVLNRKSIIGQINILGLLETAKFVLLRKGSNLVHNQFLKLGFTHYFLEVGRILAYKIYKI